MTTDAGSRSDGRPPQGLAHLLHLVVVLGGLAALYTAGITPDVISENRWWTPFIVVNLGVLLGNLAIGWLARHPDEVQAVVREGRRQDLVDSHNTVVEQLRHLETERDKLAPADYEREREALLSVVAASLRELDEGVAAVVGDVAADPIGVLAARLRAERDQDAAAFDEALVRLGLTSAPGGISGEWRGALYTSVVFGLMALLWSNAGDTSRTRTPGMGMTGGDQISPEGAPERGPMQEAGPDPRVAALEARAMADPSNLAGWNELTEMAIGRQDLQAAMKANQKALELAPADVDAMVFQAVLKAFIGRVDEAIAQLDALGLSNPTSSRPFIYKGLLTMERDPAAAAVALEKAVALEDSEQLRGALRMAQARAAGGGPVPGGSPPAAPSAPPAPPPPAGEVEVLASGTITLADASRAAGKQAIWVNLRDPAGGPPVAAKRLTPGPFPLSFQVTTADVISMGGARPIPASFKLAARLDIDGDPMTKTPEEPQGGIDGVARGATGLTVELN